MAIKTFAVNEVLTAADTNTFLANSGLVYVKSDTITSGNSKEITGAFSSTYDNYRIVISNVRLSAAGQAIFRMGTLATGNVYNYAGLYIVYGSTSITAESAASANQWWIGLVTDSTSDGGATIDLINPFASKKTLFMSSGNDPRSGGAGARSFTGFLNNTTSYTSFSLIGDGGSTFSSCDITVYGYRKA